MEIPTPLELRWKRRLKDPKYTFLFCTGCLQWFHTDQKQPFLCYACSNR